MEFIAADKDYKDLDYPEGDAVYCMQWFYCKNNEICNVLSCKDFKSKVQKKWELEQPDDSRYDIPNT